MDKYYRVDALIKLLQKHKEESEYCVSGWWLDYVLDHLPTENRKEAQKICLEFHEEQLKKHFNMFSKYCAILNDEIETVDIVNAEMKLKKIIDSIKPAD